MRLPSTLSVVNETYCHSLMLTLDGTETDILQHPPQHHHHLPHHHQGHHLVLHDLVHLQLCSNVQMTGELIKVSMSILSNNYVLGHLKL